MIELFQTIKGNPAKNSQRYFVTGITNEAVAPQGALEFYYSRPKQCWKMRDFDHANNPLPPCDDLASIVAMPRDVQTIIQKYEILLQPATEGRPSNNALANTLRSASVALAHGRIKTARTKTAEANRILNPPTCDGCGVPAEADGVFGCECAEQIRISKEARARPNDCDNARQRVASEQPAQPWQTVVTDLLRHRFPWLGTDEDAGSGADVIAQLSDIYTELGGPPTVSTCEEEGCGAALEATVKLDLSDVVLDKNGKVISYSIDGDPETLAEAIENAFANGFEGYSIYCENDHNIDGYDH